MINSLASSIYSVGNVGQVAARLRPPVPALGELKPHPARRFLAAAAPGAEPECRFCQGSPPTAASTRTSFRQQQPERCPCHALRRLPVQPEDRSLINIFDRPRSDSHDNNRGQGLQDQSAEYSSDWPFGLPRSAEVSCEQIGRMVERDRTVTRRRPVDLPNISQDYRVRVIEDGWIPILTSLCRSRSRSGIDCSRMRLRWSWSRSTLPVMI